MSAKKNPFLNKPPASTPGAEAEDAEHAELISFVRDMIDRERLHVPPALEEDPVDLPFDLTTVSDTELQQLYSAFAAYSYRSGYLLMLEEAKASKCKEAADEILEAYIASNADAEGTLTAIKAQGEQLDDVKTWRNRQRRAQILSDSLRKERDNYDKVCERLSRLETMRHDEYERAGNRLASRGAKR